MARISYNSTTNSQGVASATVTGQGKGRLRFISRCDDLWSNEYEVLDCIAYNKETSASDFLTYWNSYNITANTITVDDNGTLIETDASKYSTTYMQIWLKEFPDYLNVPLCYEIEIVENTNYSFSFPIKITDGTTLWWSSPRGATGKLRVEIDSEKAIYYLNDVEQWRTTSSQIPTQSRAYLQSVRADGNGSIKFKNFKIYPLFVAPQHYTPISLSSDKSTISTGESTTLTAELTNVLGQKMANTSVDFIEDGTVIATATTNTNGIATTTLTGTGKGIRQVTASNSTILSETYSITDIYYYDSQTVDKSKITVSKGTGTTTYSNDGLTIHGTGSDESLFLINGLTLPNEYEIEITALNMQGTGTGILLGDAILTDLDKQQSQLRIYTLQNNSYSEIAKIRNVTYQDTNNVKIDVELGALKVYLNDNLITTVNYAPTGSFKYRTYSNDRYTTFKDLKIKAL